MELKQLECFVACVNWGSFSKAAEQLFINQSNISRMVKNLEEELHTTLFLRNNKGVQLTLEGERIYQKALQIFKQLEDLGAKETKPLTYFTISTFPSQYISYAFAQMCMQYEQGNVSFRLYTAGTNKILQQLENGEIDAGFVFSSQKQWNTLSSVLRKKRLTYTPLCKVIPCLYIGAKNSLVHETTLSKDTIRSMSFLKQEYDFIEIYHDLRNTIQEYQLEEALSCAAIVNSGYGISQILLETDFCYLGHGWVREDADSIKIINPPHIKTYQNLIPLESGDGEITMGYVTRNGQEISPYFQTLIDTLLKEIIQKG